ncbi:MAG TPA: two-component sensor histidine kinase [Propionibacterium sp.]|nr:two-component sensor histidine kinase [Propionibacterium sp.]
MVFTAPQGALAILLVVIAAVAVYVVAFPVVLVIIALNTVVLVGAWIRSGNTVDQAVVGAGLYVLLQVASGLSCLSVLREQRLRRELTRAHIELQAATALLGEGARTAERLRIARDLHDTVGHALTVLSLELEAARHRPDGREHVERAGAVARDLLTDVRATVSELRDRPTDLRGALGQVVDGIPGLVIDLDVAGDVEVGEAESATLVRAVQEITTNTLRHAGATRLTLKVRRDPDGTTVLEARDDGRGARELRLGHGLHGMVERFEALGGDVRLEGRDGFAVTARVPVT